MTMAMSILVATEAAPAVQKRGTAAGPTAVEKQAGPAPAAAEGQVAPSSTRAAEAVASERLVLRTTAGDLVLALFKDAAPANVEPSCSPLAVLARSTRCNSP